MFEGRFNNKNRITCTTINKILKLTTLFTLPTNPVATTKHSKYHFLLVVLGKVAA